MNLSDVRIFLAVAETGLMHRAAAYVNLSQPAVTKAIRRLESGLGVTLFTRSTKGMRLTRYGDEFLRHAVSLQAKYEEGLASLDELRMGELAKVRVGSTPATEPLVCRTFLSLVKDRPGLRLDMRVALTDGLMKSLHDGAIDIAIGPKPREFPNGIRTAVLLTESTYIYCRKGHPLMERGEPPDAKALVGYPWVLPGKTVSIRRQIEEYFQQHGVSRPDVRVEVNFASPMAIFSLVANTNLLGVFSSAYKTVGERFGLQVTRPKEESWLREISCFVRDDSPLSPLTEKFVERLSTEAGIPAEITLTVV